MKKLFIFILLFSAMTGKAQTKMQYFELSTYSDKSNNKYSIGVVEDSTVFIPICTIQEGDALYLTLTKKETQDFLKFLKKNEKSLSKILKSNNLKAMKKGLREKYYNGCIADLRQSILNSKSVLVPVQLLGNIKISPYWFLEVNEQEKPFLSFNCISCLQDNTISSPLIDERYHKQMGTIDKNRYALCVKPTTMDIEYIHWLINILQGLLN